MNKNDRALEALRREPWAAQLLVKIDAAGGARCAPPGLLFELRFAYEVRLQCPNSVVMYERDAGVGGSTIDFLLLHDQTEWLIELTYLEESETIVKMRDSTREEEAPGIFSNRIHLTSDAENQRQTPRAELIRVGEKLEAKVWDHRASVPQKFPQPSEGHVHVLVVNMAGFEGVGFPDAAHCHEIVFGSMAVKSEWRSDPEGTIAGVFADENSRPGARALQERVHIIAFSVEDPGAAGPDDEIRRTIHLLGNPRLKGADFAPTFPVALAGAQRDPLHRSRNA
jgi:hypothetical protein